MNRIPRWFPWLIVLVTGGWLWAAGPYTVMYLDYPQIVTAVHTFNPESAGPPFIIGANAAGYTVTGLHVDQATTAGTATNATHATTADTATNATHATTADTATNVTNDSKCMLFTGEVSPDTAATQYTSLTPTGTATITGSENANQSTWIHDIGTFSNLSCISAVTPGGGKTWKFTLRHPGGANTPLTVTMSNTSVATDTTHTVTGVGDQMWDYEIVPTGTPSASVINCSLKFCLQ